MTHLSPFQFVEGADGSMSLADFPQVQLNTIEEQGTVTGRNWQAELGLPYWFEEWEQMARPRSDKRRGALKFILMDESETRLPGHPRLRPNQINLPMCPLELGHQGFLIGVVYGYLFAEQPPGVEGTAVIGLAHFFDSPLAEKAQEGVQRGIFTHVCPVLWTPDGAPPGTGALVQVSLVPGDYPGCPNARVLQ